MVGNRDFSQEMRTTALSLDLFHSAYHLGGVSPMFDPSKWKGILDIVPFVGCLKNILINNSPYNPMSGNYYGVSTPCMGKVCVLPHYILHFTNL